MRRRGWFALLGSACFLSALLLGAPPAIASSASPSPNATSDPLCTVADGLLSADKLDEAVSLFEALGSACSSDLALVVRREAEAERILKDAVDIDAAPGGDSPESIADSKARAEKKRALLEAAAVLDPTNKTVTSELEKLDALVSPPGRSLCALGYELLDRGDLAGAKAKFDAAAGNDDTKACAQAGLVAVAEAESAPWPNRVIGAVTGPLLPWLTFAAFGGLGALILMVVWSANTSEPIAPSSPDAPIAFRGGVWCGVLAAVTAIGFVWATANGAISHSTGDEPTLLGWVLVVTATMAAALIGWAQGQRRRLTIGAFTATDGVDTPDLTALVAAEFSALVGGTSAGIYLVSGTDVDEPTVADVTGLIPNKVVQTLGEIWKKLTPGIDLRLSGHLHAPAEGEAAVHVQLRHGRRLLKEQRIEAGRILSTEEPPALREVATLVAAWAVEQFIPAMSEASVDRLYGARKWQSIGLNAVAARRPMSEPATARLLARAVAADPSNGAAVFGLLSVQLQQGPAAIERGGVVVEPAALKELWLLRSAPATRQELPLSWRTELSLAVALGNYAQFCAGRHQKSVPPGITAARQASEVLAKLLPRLEKPDPADDRLARQIASLSEEVELALSVTRASNEAAPHPTPLVLARQVANRPAARIALGDSDGHYARACLYGAALSWIDGADVRPATEMLRLALGHLREAFVEPRFIKHAEQDPYLAHVCQTSSYRALVEEMTPPTPQGTKSAK